MKMLLLLKSIFSELRLDQGRISGLGWCICIKLCDELRKCLPSNRGKAEAGGMPAKRVVGGGAGEGGRRVRCVASLSAAETISLFSTRKAIKGNKTQAACVSSDVDGGSDCGSDCGSD